MSQDLPSWLLRSVKTDFSDVVVQGTLVPQLAICGCAGTAQDLLPPSHRDGTWYAMFPDGDHCSGDDSVVLGTAAEGGGHLDCPGRHAIPPAQVAIRLSISRDAAIGPIAEFVLVTLAAVGLRRAFRNDVRVYGTDHAGLELWWTFIPASAPLEGNRLRHCRARRSCSAPTLRSR
jgi:hypothetical protein